MVFRYVESSSLFSCASACASVCASVCNSVCDSGCASIYRDSCGDINTNTRALTRMLMLYTSIHQYAINI